MGAPTRMQQAGRNTLFVGLLIDLLGLALLAIDFAVRNLPEGHPFLLVAGVFALLIAAPLVWTGLLLRRSGRVGLAAAALGLVWLGLIVFVFPLQIAIWASQVW